MQRPDALHATASPDDLADELVRFFDRLPFDLVEVPQPGGGVEVQRLPANPPTPLAFATLHGLRTADLHDLATATLASGKPAYPRLARAYRRAQRVQARRIREGAEAGLYVRAAIPMFLAACRWRPQPAPARPR